MDFDSAKINGSGQKLLINSLRITFQDCENQVEIKEMCLLQTKYL